MCARLQAVVAESSVIVRSGLMAVLKRMGDLRMEVSEITDMSMLAVQLKRYKPDVLIVNPNWLGLQKPEQLLQEAGCTACRTVALQTVLGDGSVLRYYDTAVSIYDSAETIKEKLEAVLRTGEKAEAAQMLSPREKDIIIGVVKGLTNKQIADNLHISTHTVMTHRKNIAGKLQIHSPAGLTIYAIVHKLVEIGDVNP
ncbi:MAG: LuxR C-terminal-related transcriptional regulator [Bacteroidales bacterium]|nr:LuxR C-terminal-related transcriptional regulator [Bacteroidales bacterium]